jgi:hypothetical protein
MRAWRGGFTVTVLVAALTACDTGDPAPKRVEDPMFALAASVSGLKAGDYAYTVSTPTGATNSGVVDVPSDSATLDWMIGDADFRGRMTIRMVGPDRFVKLLFDTAELDLDEDGEELLGGAYWWRIDPDRLVDGDAYSVDRGAPDVTGASYLAQRVVTAQGDDRTITGTVDVTGLSGSLAFTDDLDGLGPATTALPFTVRLDERGRLTEWVLHAPAAGDVPAGDWKITATGYGTQEPQPRPPADQIKRMQSQGYAVLNG